MIWQRRTIYLLGGLGLAFLILPFFGLISATNWREFHLVSGDLQALINSLAFTGCAMLMVMLFGTPVAFWMARHEFRGKNIAEFLVLVPLLTPPLAMGILLATLYGPYGWLGQRLGVGSLTNTPAAFVLAQVYGSCPYYIVAARAAFEAVPKDLEEVALTLGKSPWQCFTGVTLPLARLGLAAGLGLAWVRALGEFGIVLIIAYYPLGMPVKLWVNLQDIGLRAVYPLLWVFFLVAMPIPLLLGFISRRGRLIKIL